MEYTWIALIVGIVGAIFAGLMAKSVMKWDAGNDKVREIAAAIKEGAIAFLKAEYRILVILLIIIAIIMVFIPGLGWQTALAFIFGAALSSACGWIGMNTSVRANSRTTTAATKSINAGLTVSFRGGVVMGMSVVSLGLIGISILYFALNGDVNFLTILPGFGFGASLVAVFARVGGGIFTKAADVGADLVGKVEKNIPEDDPRNAAVIADFVGDNVGDCAGVGADLFESYCEAIISVMVLSGVAIKFFGAGTITASTAWWLPLLIAAGGIVASMVSVFAVRIGESSSQSALIGALRKGTAVASILSVVFSVLIVMWLDAPWGIFWAMVAGLIAGIAIGEIANYYTSFEYSPTKKIAEAAQTGTGTLIIAGLAVGLMSTLVPVILVAVAVIVANHFAGLYGVAIAGVGMLATMGTILASDAYGPIADNAGGLVEMSGLPKEIRDRTDALDALGNTSKATGKGFAVGSAALTSLALMFSYAVAVGITTADLLTAPVMAGAFIGAVMPAVFCALTMQAVGRAAFAVVNEVRRQFKEIPGIMEGTGKPEYGNAVKIVTNAAIKEMIVPGAISVIVPLIVGFVLGPYALAGFLAGAVITGFIIGLSYANTGGAWDNAKKYIESGFFGGKGSEAHKAAVVGDTVGDPMKDTSGPSLNIMIKLMSIVSLVFAPVLAGRTGLF